MKMLIEYKTSDIHYVKNYHGDSVRKIGISLENLNNLAE